LSSFPSVAVVILNWNGKHFLEKFLPSIIASTYKNFQIIVADNASNDDSISFLKEKYPQIKILVSKLNEGFAKGYNTALKQVTADYYVLLNSDVAVIPTWIEPIIGLMQADKSIGACQPKILSYDRQHEFEYAGASGGFIDTVGYPFARGRVFETCEKDEGQYNNATQVFWATGAAMFVRSNVFHELQGFDEYFFAHQEEIDLCWRMQRAAYKIFVEPSSVVYHVGGGTLPMGHKKKVFLNFRNNLVMLAKNTPASEGIWKIPLRISLDAIAAYRALFSGSFSTYASIASAHLQFVFWLFRKKRSRKLPSVKMKNISAVYNGSIVWQYFIKKKKTFSEIMFNKK
jgi:GT2 family glycosyltransferase